MINEIYTKTETQSHKYYSAVCTYRSLHYMHTTQPRKVLYTHTHAHVKHVKKNILSLRIYIFINMNIIISKKNIIVDMK